MFIFGLSGNNNGCQFCCSFLGGTFKFFFDPATHIKSKEIPIISIFNGILNPFSTPCRKTFAYLPEKMTKKVELCIMKNITFENEFSFSFLVSFTYDMYYNCKFIAKKIKILWKIHSYFWPQNSSTADHNHHFLDLIYGPNPM